MKNKKWNREFPAVPQSVHQSVLDTLASLDVQEAKKVKKMKKRTVILLAAAMIAVLGVTAAAAGIFQWHDRAGEVFEAEPAVQEKLVLKEVAQPAYQTVSDNGLTISAIQTIQDEVCFYALFEVVAEEESFWEDKEFIDMEFTMDFAGKENPFGAFSCGFASHREEESSQSRYYELFGTKTEEEEQELDMNIHFTALQVEGEKKMIMENVLEGSWEFSLNVHPAESVRFEINRAYEIAGQSVTVLAVELSPLSVRLYCDGADAKALEQKLGLNLDQLDELPMYICGVKYQDGTVIEEEIYLGLSEGYGSGDYMKAARFSHVIEVEKAAALLVGEDRVEVSLQN